jgi:hypothetical protein
MIRAFPVAACCLLILSGLTTAQDGQMHEGSGSALASVLA